MNYLDSFLARCGEGSRAKTLAREHGAAKTDESQSVSFGRASPGCARQGALGARELHAPRRHPAKTAGTSSVGFGGELSGCARIAVREVLGLRADWLVGLPLPPVLELRSAEAAPVYVDFRASPRSPAFRSDEWLALARAASSERARGRDFDAWAKRKRSLPRWRLTEEQAMGGRIYAPCPVWTVQSVLEQLDAVLTRVIVET